MTSQQLLDVAAGVRRRELVDDVQCRLVIRVPDVDVHAGLQRKHHFSLEHCSPRGHSWYCTYVGDFSFHKDSFWSPTTGAVGKPLPV